MIIEANHPYLQYSGRIDDDNPQAPVFVFAASYVKMRFTGTSVKAKISNRHGYFINSLGFILDGFQGRFDLIDQGDMHTYLIAKDLQPGEHEIMLFKRMDTCHYFTFHGFEVDEDAVILPLPPKPQRRIEVFGDSVSCGEVSEALDYVGQSDPENHNGIFSNSYYSYSWITARKLGAELHDTSQGGIALMDGIGWFNMPEYQGMESCYDKIQFNPALGEVKKWDFKKYIPQVVVIAIGQNDANPEDFMKLDYEGEEAVEWRARYRLFIEKLMDLYPGATFVLTTTILGHSPAWDRAIGQVAREMNHPKVSQFLYTKNGCGTSGHIRIPEAEKMADELSAYIESLGAF